MASSIASVSLRNAEISRLTHVNHVSKNVASKRFVHIPSAESREIKNQFLEIKQSPYEYDKNFVSLAKKASAILEKYLPSKIIDAFQEVKGNERAFIEITGIPEDPELMDTPFNDACITEKKKTFISELFSMGVSGLLDQEIYNFRQEAWGTGAPIFNVYPRSDLLEIKGAGGVEDDFGFHMENAWHSQSPDFLILKGLRQDHEAVAITYAVANKTLYDALSSEERECLKNREFRIDPPEIHRRMEVERGIAFSEDSSYFGPALIEESDGIKLMANFNGMSAPAEDLFAQATLDKVEKLARELSTELKLREDNMLLVNNKRALHTRNGYTPRFDGKDRWFQRYFLLDKKILWRNQHIDKKDFPFLSSEEAGLVLDSLKDQNFISLEGTLTSSFRPDRPNFYFELPSELESKRIDILKGLLRKGPAFPNRVV